MVNRLMALWNALRRTQQKPAYIEHLDRRQDAVAEQLKVLSAESARRAQRVVQQGRY